MGLPINRIETYLNVKAIGVPCSKGPQRPDFIIDSRKLKKGDVFIAIKGQNHDAHEFITKDLREKAAMLIVSKSWYNKVRPATGCFILVQDTIKAMLQLAKCYREELGIKIVAITGSNGKTTTRSMIGRVLARKFKVFETSGNFNNRIGLPLSVFRIKPEHEIAVIEMGTNHFGEIKELSETIHPDMAVITNIGRGHLEFLKDRRGVLKAKIEILSGMGRTGELIVNNDDSLLHSYRPRRGIRKLTAGFDGNATLKGIGLSTSLIRGTTFKAEGNIVRLGIPGKGAAEDALLALLVGKRLGIPVKDALLGLKEVKVPSDRMEIKKYKGVTLVIDCYNANPDSLSNVLNLLGKEKIKGRKIAVLGNMGELGDKSVLFHRESGKEVMKNGFDVLLTLGKLGKEIAEGARKSGLLNSFAYDDLNQITSVIKASMNKGDIVLIKGSHSMHMENIAKALIKGTSE